MFEMVLNMPLPAKEKKDIKDTWIKTTDRLVLPKAICACSDPVILPIHIAKWKNR